MFVVKTEYLKLFKKFVDGKNRIPILQNIMFADDKIVGSDLDNELTIKIDMNGSSPFSVNLNDLWHIVKKQKEFEMTFDGVSVHVGGFKLETLSPIDFPLMHDFKESVLNVIDTNIFEDIAPFASKEGTRYYLKGVFVDSENLTATDGHMLASKPNGFENEMPPMIIPNLALKVIAAFGENTVFSMQNDGVKSKFEKDNIRLVSKVIDGTYPNYKMVLPESIAHTVFFNREELVDVLKKCKVQKEKGIKLIFTENNCKFKGLNFEFDVPCENEGIFERRFDQFYLSLIMSYVSDKKVKIEFDNHQKLKIGHHVLMLMRP